MDKIAFVLNGNLKGKKKLISEIITKASVHSEVSFYETQAVGDGITLSKKAIDEGFRFIISVGGDGMLNEVVNGFMKVDEDKRENITLGLLPRGTGNDFAKSIGVNYDIDQLISLIKNRSSHPIDVGKISYQSVSDEPAMRYFINITDIGIGGHVVRNVNRSNKWLGADLTYTKSIVKAFFSFKHAKISVSSPDFNWEGVILSLCMANGRYFGSGLCIAPQANIADGKIQLVILGNFSLMDYLKSMSRIKRGEIIDHPEIIYKKVESCSIRPIRGECPIDMDGEFIGYAPLQLDTMKGAIKLLFN